MTQTAVTHKIVARDAGFIGVIATPDPSNLYWGETWNHSGYTYRPTLEEAANDVLARTGQTKIEVVNLVSPAVQLAAMPDCAPQWYGTDK